MHKGVGGELTDIFINIKKIKINKKNI